MSYKESLESESLAKGHGIIIAGSDIRNLFSGAGYLVAPNKMRHPLKKEGAQSQLVRD